LLLLHGGPGGPWPDGLGAVARLAADRPVVLYHQLGCGRSDDPADPSRWTIDAFADEVALVRSHLGLVDVHVLGWSWGGLLALHHALAPATTGVKSVVLLSPVVSVPAWTEEGQRLRDALPPRARQALARYEAAYRPKPVPTRIGTPRPGHSSDELWRQARRMARVFPLLTSRPVQWTAEAMSRVPRLRALSFQIVTLQYVRRHVLRSGHVPIELFTMLAGVNGTIYEAMWGPAEWSVTGTLAGVDYYDRLTDLAPPVLVVSGRHDEATPAQMQRIVDLAPDARWEVLEESAHCGLIEEEDRFVEIVRGFLAEH
jgi:pimeloyl-ACP methyl ester carboxylesterase